MANGPGPLSSAKDMSLSLPIAHATNARRSSKVTSVNRLVAMENNSAASCATCLYTGPANVTGTKNEGLSVSRAEDSRVGLAICKGLNTGSPRTPYEPLCARWRMCPSCEAKKAGRRASRISRRLEQEYDAADGDLTIGVLTWTLPGKSHPIRRGTLSDQYQYATERVRFRGKTGDHSMRGLNRMMHLLGARGGTHFVEFTWNNSSGWWNLHGHTLFWGWEKLDHLNETSCYDFETEPDVLLGNKVNKGKRTRLLKRIGFGERYTLDYAEAHELDLMVRYSAKVAYATKPFKAPAQKGREIRDFLEGHDHAQPRLARPFGEQTRPHDHIGVYKGGCSESTMEWLRKNRDYDPS